MKNVTIAMSTFNGHEFLREQLDSIVLQTIINRSDIVFSIVVRDDGSSDDTIDILKEYAIKYTRINWKIIEGENIGWKKSFISLLQLISSDYIFLCDQDDIWAKDKCQIMIEKMEKIRK